MPVLCSRSRLNSVSVVFDFKASLSDVAPVSSIPLSVDSTLEKSVLLISVICVLFLFVLTAQSKLSECCVCFQCITQRHCSSASNPVSCLFVDKGKTSLLMDVICMLFLFVITFQIKRSECCV